MRLTGTKNNEEFETILDYHICTEADFAQFSEPANDFERKRF